MPKSLGQPPNYFKTKRLPQAYGMFVGADYKIELHRPESLNSRRFY
jgi:hypothetical protein